MKLWNFALLLALAPFTGFADDGGVVGISVHDLAMYNTTDFQHPTKVENPNFRIDVTGGEATKLLSILPSDLSVLTTMYPRFAKTFNANFRSLAITGKKDQPGLVISCAGGEMKFDSNGANPTFTAYRDGAHCTVTVDPMPNEDLNIDYKFNPAKDVCKWFR